MYCDIYCILLPGATGANLPTALATLIDGDETAQGDPEKYEVDVYIACTLNDGSAYSGWEVRSSGSQKGGTEAHRPSQGLPYLHQQVAELYSSLWLLAVKVAMETTCHWLTRTLGDY